MEQVRAEHHNLAAIPHLQGLLDAFPRAAVILNESRQIVAANQRLCEFLHRRPYELLGMRIGEAFNCIHWREGRCGCGTSRFCRTCGAAQAILSSQGRGMVDIQECNITTRTGEGKRVLDLRVTASTFRLGESFTIFSLNDISGEKRRAALERIFFHDVLATTAGVRNLLEMLPNLPDQYRYETTHLTRQLVEYLIEEIEGGRDLVAAERGDLAVHAVPLDAREILYSLCEVYAHHPLAEGKTVFVAEMSGPSVITTDRLLLRRILGNLIKNGLEASEEGQEVSLAFRNYGVAVFSVHYETAPPGRVRLELLRKAASDKSISGHEIGTYSAKLITERYLGGSFSFTRSEERGTTYAVTLPSGKPA
jgi:K+-sensing histidine kinase KdpD